MAKSKMTKLGREIAAINATLEKTRTVLGEQSALYHQQVAAVSAILSGTGLMYESKKHGYQLHTGRKAEAELEKANAAAMASLQSMIKQTLTMNSLAKERKKLTAEIRKKRLAQGATVAESRRKITEQELKQAAKRKMTMQQRFQELVDYASDSKASIPYWGKISGMLKDLHGLKSQKAIVQAQQDIVTEIMQQRDEAERTGHPMPSSPVIDDIEANGF